MKKNAQEMEGRFRRVASFAAPLAFATHAGAQYGPMAPCADPAPMQVPRSPTQNWYPTPAPGPPFGWADRRPTAVIPLYNGDWQTNERGLEWRWWDANHYPNLPPYPTCVDAPRHDESFFDVESGHWTGPSNGRPDQIDWLLAHLQNRWDRGYRRIVLFLPAGVPRCQVYGQAQWWPMAQWRRDWFETVGTAGTPTQGIKGWIEQHQSLAIQEGDRLEIGIYVGWWIGNACTICTSHHPDVTGNCDYNETNKCPPPPDPNYVELTGLWMPCTPGYTTQAPSTLLEADLKVVWQNIQPWRDIGATRFWIDNSSGHATLNESYEWRQFVYNPNLVSVEPPITFGGEAYPTESQAVNGRYPLLPLEFDYSPWMIDLTWAERACQNGAPCNNLSDSTAHQWDFRNLIPEAAREAAIYFSEWPRCSYSAPANPCDVPEEAPLHPHWDEFGDANYEYYPFQRIENLYNWYICKGCSFWQGDLPGASGATVVSGAAERIFGFGQIKPPGDFDGDGEWLTADWVAYQRQYEKWGPGGSMLNCGEELWRYTYYHGDMNSDGVVDQADLGLAVDWIQNNNWQGQGAYYLGEGGNNPLASHRLNWNPNGIGPDPRWLPCPCEPPTNGPAFGPP